ncbi:hypoxanthine phosphoribosyltransferase [Clostridiales bacterium KA00134]|nr:hypoxanthine phosphoribosyltransferase [Clostridiales bacterium KA00134]
MKESIERILFTEEELAQKIREMGKRITEDYKGKKLLCLGILKGSVVFMSELIKRIDLPLEIDFMDVSSYVGTQSSGEVRILKDLDYSVAGKDILIIEDIIDTGITLNYLVKLFKHRNVNSVLIATLLSKPRRRKIDVDVKYVGFDIEDLFVVGYGLDYNEQFRNLPYIGVLKEEVYK